MPKGETSKNFAVVLYPVNDTLQFDIVFDRIRDIADKWSYILHDSDGVKDHYHVLFATHNQRSAAAVKKDLGIDNGLELVKSYAAYEKYMLHGDQKSVDEGKHLYPDCSLVRSSFDDLRHAQKSKEERELENALNYYSEIAAGNIRCTGDLIKLAISSGSWGFLRQNYTIFRDFFREVECASIAERFYGKKSAAELKNELGEMKNEV